MGKEEDKGRRSEEENRHFQGDRAMSARTREPGRNGRVGAGTADKNRGMGGGKRCRVLSTKRMCFGLWSWALYDILR